jgi:hypothetical protein
MKRITGFTGIVIVLLIVISHTACSQSTMHHKTTHNDTTPAKGDKKNNDFDKSNGTPTKDRKLLEKEIFERDMAALKEYEKFLDDLQKDGLLDRKKHFKVEHKKEELIINGNKQPVEVYNRYRSFFEKHRLASIKQDADGFLIRKD